MAFTSRKSGFPPLYFPYWHLLTFDKVHNEDAFIAWFMLNNYSTTDHESLKRGRPKPARKRVLENIETMMFYDITL